jgi:hypothetical protein
MAKSNRTVVRNAAYTRGALSIRERHNERLNEAYSNADIIPERATFNVRFKSCAGTYEQAFDKLVAGGVISTRGLSKDPKIVDEMIFDVNTGYFEEHGGYDFARQFYAEAYKLAVAEAGGEDYVLSAVMHADERNIAESEKRGYDVFHYHLHVVYVPVVDKEIRWTKRCKDAELVGTVKEVVRQVSHSKKWPRFKGENGAWVNSYSLLQDRFFDRMREAGFTDFERGERGSTAEHLADLEYKSKQEAERAVALAVEVDAKQKTADALDKKLAVAKRENATIAEVEKMAKPALFGGNLTIMPGDWAKVKNLAKEGVKSRGIIAGLKATIKELRQKVAELIAQIGKKPGLVAEMRYYQAFERAPQKTAAAIAEILRQPPERKEAERTPQQRSKTAERGI